MRPIVNVSEEDTGNTHKKFSKDRACGSWDILADSQTFPQTHRQTHRQTYSPQYYGEVTSGYMQQGVGQIKQHHRSLLLITIECIFILW